MQESFELILMLPYLVAVYSIFRLSVIMYNEKFRLIEISFFVFIYVFLGLSPIAQIQLGHFPYSGVYGETDILHAFIIIYIGIIGYEIGLAIHKYRRPKNKIKSETQAKYFNLKSLMMLILVSIVLFVFSSLFLGVNNLFLPRNIAAETEDISSSIGQLLGKLQQVPIYISLLFALVLWKYKSPKGIKTYRDLLLLLSIITLLIFNLIINNPISSPRYWFGAVYLSIIIVFMKWGRLSQTKIIFLFIFIFIVLFPYADLFRNSLEANIEIREIILVLASGDFDAFQQVMNSKVYTDIYGYSFGYQLIGVLLFWVPRSIWTDKPVGTGYTIGEGLGYEFLNISASLWVEFFVNFSFIGVILLFALYGYLTSYIQKKYIESERKKEMNFITIFTPFFAAYQFFLLRGDLLSSFAYLAPIIIVIIIGLNFKFKRKITNN
ncbi:O-antigen polysaccharide polymerase Wzy [Salinicoccus halitifaciens]|nr:O-antigen polysaccharide polymerase Wzy [Salinicoccus halitifaciens]